MSRRVRNLAPLKNCPKDSGGLPRLLRGGPASRSPSHAKSACNIALIRPSDRFQASRAREGEPVPAEPPSEPKKPMSEKQKRQAVEKTGRCEFFIAKKKRNCTQFRLPGTEYCGAHQQTPPDVAVVQR